MKRRAAQAVAAMIAAASAGLAGAAPAAEIVSQYTSIETGKCRKIDGMEIEGSQVYAVHSCPGIGGYRVLVNDDDDRHTVSVGRTVKAAHAEPAASEGFAAFNTALDTVEWRGEKSRPPFAIIQRWSIADAENPQPNGRPASAELLIVTRLPPGPVCQVAFVDAKANGADGNRLARETADTLARGFDCRRDDVRIVGKPGRATALAARKSKTN